MQKFKIYTHVYRISRRMCPFIHLTCKELEILIDMLENYLDDHSHDIRDFDDDYWEEREKLTEGLKELYNELCEEEETESNEDVED